MFKHHWQSRCLLKLALLYFLLGQLTKQSVTKNMPRGCSKVRAWSEGTNCTCHEGTTSSRFDYEFECQVIGSDSTFSIQFISKFYVVVTCSRLDALDYNLLPHLNESRYSTLHIMHCPLPPRQPVQSIFSKLGLTAAHELLFEWRGGLQRVHLEGLQNVSLLVINSTDTSHLPQDLFADLGNLTHLKLLGNSLINLPDGLLAVNKNLSWFKLYENRVQLKQLPGRLLGNLPKLREVRLSCGLDTIPADVFVNSGDIREITITENNLTELPLKLFADQANLRFLDLSRNQLMSLPDEIFRNTKKLRVLKLSHNHLVTLTNRILFYLNSLQKLYVDNNNLLTIHLEAFVNNNGLHHVDMENNQISDSTFQPHELTHSPFEPLSELELNLKRNKIRTVPKLWTIRNVRAIDLSYNEITTIEIESLDGSLYNIRLDLSNNLIQKVHCSNSRSNCSGQNIVLDLSGNPINCDCALLPFVQFLESQAEDKCIDFVKDTVNKFQCSNPPNLESRTVTELSPQEVLCPLEGESFSVELCPENCSCWVRAAVGIAIVNCSNTDHTEMPILPKLTSRTVPNVHGTELHIDNNRLTQLPNAYTPGYMHVVELHASNNRLTEVLAINLPKNLTLLDLSHNRIQHLHDTTLSVLNGSRITVALSGNPWICDCAARGLLRYVLLNREQIRDVEQMECVDGQKFQDLPPNIICSANQDLVIAASVAIAIVGLFAGIIATLCYKYKQELKVWLYARGMCFWFVTEEDLDKDKQYDAFISYSHRDEDFIVNDLLPQLETGPTPFKVCLHSRDWVVGEFIPDQILRSVAESRRTIIVLSPNFLESIWARMEFRTAHSAALKEGRARVIVILYGDVGNIGSLDPDLKAYLQMNTYVKWGDPWFWKKLRYVMPHPPKNVLETSPDNNMQLVESSPVNEHHL